MSPCSVPYLPLSNGKSTAFAGLGKLSVQLRHCFLKAGSIKAGACYFSPADFIYIYCHFVSAHCVSPFLFVAGYAIIAVALCGCSPVLLVRLAGELFFYSGKAAVGFKHLCASGNLNLPYPVPLLCGVLGSAFAYFVRFRSPFVVSIILPSVDIVNMSFSTNILPSYCLFCLLPSVATCAIIAIVEKGLSLAPLPAYIERGV